MGSTGERERYGLSLTMLFLKLYSVGERYTKLSVEQWWNDVERLVQEHSEKNVPHGLFAHHKYHMSQPGMKPRSQRQ